MSMLTQHLPKAPSRPACFGWHRAFFRHPAAVRNDDAAWRCGTVILCHRGKGSGPSHMSSRLRRDGSTDSTHSPRTVPPITAPRPKATCAVNYCGDPSYSNFRLPRAPMSRLTQHLPKTPTRPACFGWHRAVARPLAAVKHQFSAGAAERRDALPAILPEVPPILTHLSNSSRIK